MTHSILKQAWRRGIEPFLYFGELTAHRLDHQLLTEDDRIFIKANKQKLIAEIKSQRPENGDRVDLEKLAEL